MSSSIEEIIAAIGAERIGDRPATIDWILTDSRSLCFPEETLFFALKTKRNDGHKYIADLHRRGVRNFVVSEQPEETAGKFADSNFLKVANPLKALQKLAAIRPREIPDPHNRNHRKQRENGGQRMALPAPQPGQSGHPFTAQL